LAGAPHGLAGRDRFLQRIMPSRWKRGSGRSRAGRWRGAGQSAVRPGDGRCATARRARGGPSLRLYRSQPRSRPLCGRSGRTVGFFSAIFGSLSSIPREQPIRDNLETLEQQSRERARLRSIVDALQPEIEETVERLFGYTLFFDQPNRKRLTNWRNKAQQAAAEQAGYAFHGYAQVKFAGIVSDLVDLIVEAAPDAAPRAKSRARCGRTLSSPRVSTSWPNARAVRRRPPSAFPRARYRFPHSPAQASRPSADLRLGRGRRDHARSARGGARYVYRAQALYQGRETAAGLGPGFAASAAVVASDPGRS
jgi:hypothetical protein